MLQNCQHGETLGRFACADFERPEKAGNGGNAAN